MKFGCDLQRFLQMFLTIVILVHMLRKVLLRGGVYFCSLESKAFV